MLNPVGIPHFWDAFRAKQWTQPCKADIARVDDPWDQPIQLNITHLTQTTDRSSENLGWDKSVKLMYLNRCEVGMQKFNYWAGRI